MSINDSILAEAAAKPSRGPCPQGRTSLYSGLLTIHGRHALRPRPHSWFARTSARISSTSFCVAVLIHALIFLAFFHIYKIDTQKVGWKKATVIQSYLYKPEKSHSEKKHTKARNKRKKPKAELHKNMYDSEIRQNKISTISSKQQTQKQLKANLSQGHYNNLLIKLHNLIEQHQNYPSASKMLGQQGTVEVSFVLLPNGNIEQLKIIKSSGYHLLDQAALQAVRAIVPVEGVRLNKCQKLTLKLGYFFNN